MRKQCRWRWNRVARLGLLSVLLAAGMALAGTPDAFADARLVVTPVSFDCGSVPEGAPASMTAVLQNAGDAALTVKGVRTN